MDDVWRKDTSSRPSPQALSLLHLLFGMGPRINADQGNGWMEACKPFQEHLMRTEVLRSREPRF
jgi:hypothetical protein